MLPVQYQQTRPSKRGKTQVEAYFITLICYTEREERERAERAKREEELREYQERVKKLEEVERKKRQRELEIEERERRREEERRLGDDPLSRKVSIGVTLFLCDVFVTQFSYMVHIPLHMSVFGLGVLNWLHLSLLKSGITLSSQIQVPKGGRLDLP